MTNIFYIKTNLFYIKFAITLMITVLFKKLGFSKKSQLHAAGFDRLYFL